MSGSIEVAFCSRGISCCLTVADLERIRGKYQLSDDFSQVVPSRDAHDCQLKFVTLYEDVLTAVLRLPLQPLARDVLIFLGIAPGQLAPNGWRFLMGACMAPDVRV